MKETPLTAKQDKFVCAYISCGEPSTAYKTAYGGSHTGVSKKANVVLNIPKVKAKIKELQQAMQEYAKLEAKDIVKIWEDTTTAHPSDIVKVRRIPCGLCIIPEGVARRISKPQQDCSHCGGDGDRYIDITPTDELSPQAKRLYAGARLGKYGVEIILRDQEFAANKLAHYNGMFRERIEITGKDGAPLQSISAVTSDPIEAAQMYQQLMSGRHRKS